jgi:hypothetical protein
MQTCVAIEGQPIRLHGAAIHAMYALTNFAPALWTNQGARSPNRMRFVGAMRRTAGFEVGCSRLNQLSSALSICGIRVPSSGHPPGTLVLCREFLSAATVSRARYARSLKLKPLLARYRRTLQYEHSSSRGQQVRPVTYARKFRSLNEVSHAIRALTQIAQHTAEPSGRLASLLRRAAYVSLSAGCNLVQD